MIRKLRTKFIVLAMVAVFFLLAIVVAGMNIINYRAVIQDSEDTLEYLANNRGMFPDLMRPEGIPGEDSFGGFSEDGETVFPPTDSENNAAANQGNNGADTENNVGTDPKELYGAENQEDVYGDGFRPDSDKRKLPDWMSPETPYETRFFSVVLDEEGTVRNTDINRIASVSEEQATEYAERVFYENRDEGFIGDYLFLKTTDEEGVRITFLDCGRKLASARTFLIISLIVAAAGYALFFFVIFFYSKRITKPVAESYEKQKRFITDAGHEIKTPLAIIKADADVLEMDYENNEWIEDIQKQTERLTALTNDLVSLARMEEGSDPALMTEVAFSELAEEETDAYEMMAISEEKKIERKIQPAVFITGNEKSLRRLVNILMDNALKYSPEGSTIDVSLKKSGRQIQLQVSNRTKELIEKESLSLLFDRFYRTDASRNSETGGHGIGLSMAKAIAESHGGKIQAGSEDGNSLTIEVILPA